MLFALPPAHGAIRPDSYAGVPIRHAQPQKQREQQQSH